MWLFLSITVSAAVFTHVIRKVFLARERRRFLEQMTEAMESITCALRAGSTFVQALTYALTGAEDPFRKDFERILHGYRLGVPFEQGLDQLCLQRPLESLFSLRAAFKISQTSGGSLAHVLEHLHQTLRNTESLQQKVGAISSQALLQAWITSFLPIILFLFMRWIDPTMVNEFLAGSWAQPVFAAVLFLMTLAFFTIQRLITFEV